MKKEINVYEFAQEFKEMNRDYYSWEGYEALFEYYEEFPDFNLDVIAICCDVTEYDGDEIKENCNHLIDFEEFKEENKELYTTEEEMQEEYLNSLVEELEQNTTIIKLSNGSFLVWEY